MLSFYLQEFLKTVGNTSLTFRSWLLKYVSFWDFFIVAGFSREIEKWKKNVLGLIVYWESRGDS